MTIRILLFLQALMLVGCGGGEPDTDATSDTVQVFVQANDKSVFINKNAPQLVDLSDRIVFSEQASFKLKDVALADSSQGKAHCRNIVANVNPASFVVHGDDLGLCNIDYTIEVTPSSAQAEVDANADVSGEVAVRFIGEEQLPFAQSIALPIIIKNIANQDSVAVDLVAELGSEFPTDFTLDGVPLISGSGVSVVDYDNQIISISHLEPGQTQVYYQLVSQDRTEVKFGTISIASRSAAADLPSISDIYVEKTALEAHTIKVQDYLPEGETLDGLQLIDVIAFDDIVSLVNDGSNSNSFNLEATLPGRYRAALVFTDHLNSNIMSSAIIKVVNPFGDIVVGDLVFAAPFTTAQAEYAKLGYIDTFIENGSAGPKLDFPLYDFNTADNVCKSLGAYLPSTQDLRDLFAQEGNVFNGPNQRNWPTSKVYWSSDPALNGLQGSAYQAVNLATGAQTSLSVAPDSTENKAYVTCIVLTPQTFSIEGAERLSTGQTWTYTISFDTLSGQRYNYTKPVTWSSSDSDVLQINAQGIATAIKQGEVTLTAKGLSDDFTITLQVEVITLPDELKVQVLIPETTAGSQRQFRAIGYFDNGDSHDFTDSVQWHVSDDNLARIYSKQDDNTSGILKAFSAGQLTVSASLGTPPSTINSDAKRFRIYNASSRNTCYPLRATPQGEAQLFFTCNLTEQVAQNESVSRSSMTRTGSESTSTNMPVGREESLYSLNQARALCNSLAEPGDYWVPKASDLSTLFQTYDGEIDINHTLYTVYDWSTFDAYNTESLSTDGTPLVYNLASAVSEPNSNGEVAMTSCVTNKLLAAGVGNGFSNNFSFNPITAGIPANDMMRSAVNFGPQGTVPSRGFIYDPYRRANDILTKIRSKNPPQLVVIAYDQQAQFNSNDAKQTLVDYLKRGGAVLYLNQNSGANELIEAVFGTGDVFTDGNIGSAGSVFQFADIDDPILNGSFGKLQNEYWGTDRTGSRYIESRSGFYPDDMIIYSVAEELSNPDSHQGVTALRHAKYKFVWIGDSGFLGGQVGQSDPSSRTENPFAYTGDYVPAKNTNYGRAQNNTFDVSNSIFYANFLEWVLNAE